MIRKHTLRNLGKHFLSSFGSLNPCYYFLLQWKSDNDLSVTVIYQCVTFLHTVFGHSFYSLSGCPSISVRPQRTFCPQNVSSVERGNPRLTCPTHLCHRYASPKVTKYPVYHSFMSSYIFIHQLFYIRVILSYIYVKTISSVSVWFLLYQAISYMHQINHYFIHEVVNIFISSCVHILYIKKGEMSFWSEVPSRRGVWRQVIGVYSRVLWKEAFIDPAAV